MKIIKKTFSYGIKLSHNYNSYSVSEGVEAEMEDGDDFVSFEGVKAEVIARVKKTARILLEEAQEEPKEVVSGKGRDLLDGE